MFLKIQITFRLNYIRPIIDDDGRIEQEIKDLDLLKADDGTVTNNIRHLLSQSTIIIAQTAFNPNFIISDQMEMKLNKDHKSMIKNKSDQQTASSEAAITDTCNLMNIKNCRVLVKIIELKFLSGTNENVYCTVQVGNQQKFRTSEKSIETLIFNEVKTKLNSHQVHSTYFLLLNT
jgi:hypothetical protein